MQKFGKRGIEEVKTLDSNEPTILDSKEFNYDNCSLETGLKNKKALWKLVLKT